MSDGNGSKQPRAVFNCHPGSRWTEPAGQQLNCTNRSVVGFCSHAGRQVESGGK